MSDRSYIESLRFLFRHTRFDDDQHFATIDDAAYEHELQRGDMLHDIAANDLSRPVPCTDLEHIEKDNVSKPSVG